MSFYATVESLCYARLPRRARAWLASLAIASMVVVAPAAALADGASSFSQTTWGSVAGSCSGQSSSPALAPNNNTGWIFWWLKESTVSPVNSCGDLIVVGNIISVEHTTDIDFALAVDSVTLTADADFTTTVGGVAPVLNNVAVSGGSIRLASGQTTGTYTSSLVDTGTHYGLKSVSFSASVPSGTKISADGDPGNFLATVYVRAGSSTTPGDGTWTAWQEFANGFLLGSLLERRYVQFQAQFDTTNVAVSPTLDDITISYVNYPNGTGVEVASGSVGLKAGFNSASYFSRILDLGKARELTTLDFDRTAPTGTSANVLVRAGSAPSPTAAPTQWTAWQTLSASGASLAALGLKQYVQYRVDLVTTSGSVPTLDRVRVNYRDDPDDGPKWLQSSRFETGNAASHVDALYWAEDASLPAGTEVRLQLATAATAGGIGDNSFVGPDNTDGTWWDSADTHNGGCFKVDTWVACTKLPAAMQDGANDGVFAYKVTLVASGGNSPILSDVIVRYGTGNRHAVSVIPVGGIVLTESPPPADTATVGVVLHTQPANDVTISFSSSDTDEVTVSPASLTFTNGDWDTPQYVTLTSVDDGDADGDQSVTISTAATSADNNYNGIAVSDISVTNQDDDKYTVTIVATDENAAEAGLDQGMFTISLNGVAAANTDISFAVSGSANHAGSDYTKLISPATVLIGNQTVTLSVTPVNDNLPEESETVTVTLVPGAGYTVGSPSSATVTIFDDEVASVPTVSVTASTTNAREADGTQGFFTISRTGLKTDPLAVFFAIGGSATPVSDYTAIVGTSVIIPAGSSNTVIAVKPVNDSIVEGDETVTLTLSSDADYVIGSPGTATVTITDDDTAPVSTGGGGGGGAVSPWLLALLGLVGYRACRRTSAR